MLDVALFDYGAEFDVAEHREFLAHIVGHRLFGAADQDVGLYADFAQFCDALLGGLCFEFARSLQIRQEGDVDKEDVFLADFERELAQGFQEGEAFDVADGTADFGDEDVDVFAGSVHTVFNLVRDVGNDLNGFAEVIAAAFLLEDVFVDLPRSEVVETAEFAVGEAFVVPQVEVGFGAVVENVDFAVLEGAHCPGVDVQIGVEFLDSDL